MRMAHLEMVSKYRFWFMCLEKGLKCCVSNKFPGDVGSASLRAMHLRTTSWKHSTLASIHFWAFVYLSGFQFSSVTQSCPTLSNPMNCSTLGLPVQHQLPGFTQTHAQWVSDAIQPFHSLSPPSPPAFNLSKHQGLFKSVSSSHQVAKVLEFQLQHQSSQSIFRTDFL